MPTDQLPDDVRRMLAERTEARDARDWDRADALRDRLASLGWEVQDTTAGSSARPILAPDPAATTETVAHLDEPAKVAVSVQVAAEEHPDDLVRCLNGLAGHPPTQPWELVIVDNAPAFDLAEALARSTLPIKPVVLTVVERLGWADARTLGLRASSGEVTLLLDTSIEPVGDFVTPLLAAFDDPTVGIAGPWGVTSPDARQFEEATPGEVDAIEAYCLAVRRDALRSVGGFDRRFRFYRNADLDFSFAVRDAGWRAIRTEPLPLRRHEHRGWASVPPDERDRLSKRNFYRFLDHWGARTDLLVTRER